MNSTMKRLLQRAMPALLVCVLAVAVLGQTQPVSLKTEMPPPVVYRMFFGHTDFLVQKAVSLESAGKPGDGFRKYYQRKIGLTDADQNALLLRAAAFTADLAGADQAATNAIDAIRKQYPPPQTGAPPAAAITQVHQIQSQSDARILGHAAQLKAEMSTAGYSKLQTFLNGEFLHQVSSRPLSGSVGSLGSSRSVALRSAARTLKQ